MKRLPAFVWFSTLLILASVVARQGTRIYAWRTQRVANSPLSIGWRDPYRWFDILGARFTPDEVLPTRNLIMFGAFGAPVISAEGLRLRVNGRDQTAGVYFVSELEPGRTYRVSVTGETLVGRAIAQLRCRSDDDLERADAALPNLLDTAVRPARPVWQGTGVVTPHVDGPKGEGTGMRLSLTSDHNFTYQTSQTLTKASEEEMHQLSFWARLVSGGPDVEVVINRAGGYDDRAALETLTREWRRYSVVREGPWTGKTQVQIVFNRLGGDIDFEIAEPRLTSRLTNVDTRVPWMLTGWTPAGAPDRAAGINIPLAGKTATVSVSGARQLAWLLSGDEAYQYRIDHIELAPADAGMHDSAARCVIN